VPNYSEFFLQVGAGAVPTTLYTDPRNPGQPVPILARGNPSLKVEKITGYEVGYKGVFFDKKVFVTIDGYFNQAKDFITDLLQGVNSLYPYNPPAGLAEYLRTRIPGITVVNGKPAVVVSYTNAGKVDEKGVEVGFNYYVDDEFMINGNWTWYDFKVKEQQAGDILLPNAPKHKFAAGWTWSRPDGIDLSMSARNVQPFRWAAGVFAGDVPAYTIVNGSFGYRISKNYRLGITVNNLFDKKMYQLFGGSVIGRQAIGSITATF
jgi:iron complex outermembrane receptor protein